MDQSAVFRIGQRVTLKADPSLQGAVIAVHNRADGGVHYTVFHSAELTRTTTKNDSFCLKPNVRWTMHSPAASFSTARLFARD
jgi:hypothetical protein